MKFTLELTKKELYDYDFFHRVNEKLNNKYKNQKEFLDDFEVIIDIIINDAFKFPCKREIIIDGYYLNQFIARNKTEITNLFKNEYNIIFIDDIDEAECCFTCAEVYDKKLNSEEKIWCRKHSIWVKPINHCKNWC